MASGLKNREIARELGIAEHVVRNYLGIIYDKIGVSNRVELALWYEARTHEAKMRKVNERMVFSVPVLWVPPILITF